MVIGIYANDGHVLEGKRLLERIEDLLELKMNMKRKIPMKKVVREKGSTSNAPPMIVTFEEQVRAICPIKAPLYSSIKE